MTDVGVERPALTAPLPLPDTAPAGLHGLLQLLNTRGNEHFGETLGSRPDAERYVTAAAVDATRVDLERLVAVRELVVQAIADPATTAPWEGLDALAADTPLRLRFPAPASARVVSADDDVAGELLARVDEAIASGAWPRLRICARPQCRLAFYDATRSRTGRWCSHTCANRSNVAAHRARRAGGPAAAGDRG
jgi:predicted RNA-binding Zn ribbon-like protein